MNQQDDAFSKNFTVILTVVICGIVGLAAFEQFVSEKIISAEETEANIRPVGLLKTKAVSEPAQATPEPVNTEVKDSPKVAATPAEEKVEAPTTEETKAIETPSVIEPEEEKATPVTAETTPVVESSDE